MIFHFNDKSISSFTLKTDLIKLMINERGIFNDRDFIALNYKCFQLAEKLSKSGDVYRILLLCQFGEKIDEILKEEETCNWKLLIARHYENLMIRNLAEPLISINWCLQALQRFKELKDQIKVKQLEDKYKELKSLIKLETIEYKVDQTDFSEKCIKLAKELAESPPESIIGYLLFSNNLLPSYENLERQVEQQSKDFPLLNIFPSTILDQNIHPSQRPNENNIKYNRLIDNYRVSIETSYLYFISHIFIEAIKSRKLSFASLMAFFKEISWFGNSIYKPMPDGNYREFNWLGLIAPALNEYFLQMEYFLSSGKIPNYLLAIDSLTLKIEGIVRDFCEFSDITTFFTKTEKTGIIVREKDINALLHDPKLNNILGNNDILLLRFLLIEPGGYKLRHNVAHSLMTYWEYNINLIHILILILLRLSKYDFIKRHYLFCLNQS